ncbi:hypothetical protein D9M72_325060 [compost metagenome]
MQRRARIAVFVLVRRDNGRLKKAALGVRRNEPLAILFVVHLHHSDAIALAVTPDAVLRAVVVCLRARGGQRVVDRINVVRPLGASISTIHPDHDALVLHVLEIQPARVNVVDDAVPRDAVDRHPEVTIRHFLDGHVSAAVALDQDVVVDLRAQAVELVLISHVAQTVRCCLTCLLVVRIARESLRISA